MKVWVVVKQDDKGVIAGVFATLQLASKYIACHPYSAFTVEEMTVVVDKAKANA